MQSFKRYCLLIKGICLKFLKNVTHKRKNKDDDDDLPYAALGNAMVGVSVYDHKIPMNSDECRVPQRTTGERQSQLWIEATHDVSGAPPPPDIRVNDDEYHEEQCTQIVDTQTDDEHVEIC